MEYREPIFSKREVVLHTLDELETLDDIFLSDIEALQIQKRDYQRIPDEDDYQELLYRRGSEEFLEF